jgi:hypothetical protein
MIPQPEECEPRAAGTGPARGRERRGRPSAEDGGGHYADEDRARERM